jgi:proton-dependent oligopeptide transporter, POT family
VLALDVTRLGLALGLTLIAVGSGGIKPCVSAHVGDQFGRQNQHLLAKVFGWFYFAINFGAFCSTLLTPWLLENLGPHWAFGVPGLLMAAATLLFWLGRNKFVHIPPGGLRFVRQASGGEGRQALLKLISIYVFVMVFWSLYDQTGSRWVLQAEKMDRHWLGVHWYASQVQAINPILILVYIPLFSYVIYPLINQVFTLTPLRKISIGFFLAALTFMVTAQIEVWIQAELQPSIAWQLLAYVILTAGEVMVSITCLEFSYTQAPREMKSLVMAIYLLSVSAGNAFTAIVNELLANESIARLLAGANYYWFFAGLMGTAAVLFIFVAANYRERTYIQEEQPAAESLPAAEPG